MGIINWIKVKENVPIELIRYDGSSTSSPINGRPADAGKQCYNGEHLAQQASLDVP